MRKGREECYKCKASCYILYRGLVSGPTVGESCLDTSLGIAGANFGQGELRKAFQIWDLESNAWDSTGNIKGRREANSVCTDEIVCWQGTQSPTKDTAEVDSDIDWTHPVGIEEEVGRDIYVRCLQKRCKDFENRTQRDGHTTLAADMLKDTDSFAGKNAMSNC